MSAHRTAKARGSAAERELLHLFYEAGWGGIRAAGSGSIPLEVPDVLAGHNGRVIAVEAKYCRDNRQYLRDQEILDLLAFGVRFGCETWVGVKFSRRGWHFVPATALRSSGKHYVISWEEAVESGKTFPELIA